MSLDDAVGVFHYGLPSSVEFLVNIKPFFVSMYQICVFGAFQDSSVFVFGAFNGKGAQFAFVGFVVLYFMVGFRKNLVVLVSVTGECFTGRTGSPIKPLTLL